MEVNPACVRCGEEETISIFFGIANMQRMYGESHHFIIYQTPKWILISPIYGKQSEFLSAYHLQEGVSSTPLAAWICWRFWKSRNNLVFNRLVSPESETVREAIVNAKEWMEAQNQKQIFTSRLSAEPVISSPDAVNLFTDASCSKESLTAGVASIIVKNDREIGSSASPIRFVGSPLTAEAITIKNGLQLVLSLDFKEVEVHSDSQIFINAINKGIELSEIHGVLLDITKIFPLFSAFSFRYVSRSQNSRADCLAKEVLRSVIV